MTKLSQLENPDNIINLILDLQRRVEELAQANVSARSLSEISPDAGELGSGNISSLSAGGQMASTLFASGTQTIFQNVLRITKSGGKLSTDVLSSDTSIDFGMAMTVGDWVVFEGSDANENQSLEWVLVGALSSGTRYDVTRNVDGSGANDWRADTPFAVIGKNGDYRIEIIAGATPSIKLIKQGASWNVVTNEFVANPAAIYIDKGSYYAIQDGGVDLMYMSHVGAGIGGFLATIPVNNSSSLSIIDQVNATYDANLNLSAQSGSISALISMFASSNGLGSYPGFTAVGRIRAQRLIHQFFEGSETVDMPGHHYDPLSALLAPRQNIAAWKPDAGYVGTGATLLVIDKSGQDRNLTPGGTVSYGAIQTGNYPEVPYASIAAGANYLERADEAAFDNARTNFSAVGWFYFSDVNYSTAIQFIMGQANGAYNTVNYQWGIINSNAWSSGQHRLTLYTPNGTNIVGVNHSTFLSNNTWYFVAMRFTSATEIALWVGNNANGLVKVTSASGIPTTLNNSAGAFRIFRRGDNNEQTQGGRCSLVGLYAGALDDKTIRAIFQSQRDYFGV